MQIQKYLTIGSYKSIKKLKLENTDRKRWNKFSLVLVDVILYLKQINNIFCMKLDKFFLGMYIDERMREWY